MKQQKNEDQASFRAQPKMICGPAPILSPKRERIKEKHTDDQHETQPRDTRVKLIHRTMLSRNEIKRTTKILRNTDPYAKSRMQTKIDLSTQTKKKKKQQQQ